MSKMTGHKAIKYAEAHGLTLNKYTDPTEDARTGLTPDEARAIAREDASLIWIEVKPQFVRARFRDPSGMGRHAMVTIDRTGNYPPSYGADESGSIGVGREADSPDAQAECLRELAKYLLYGHLDWDHLSDDDDPVRLKEAVELDARKLGSMLMDAGTRDMTGRMVVRLLNAKMGHYR